MRQILCDLCGEPITDVSSVDEPDRVMIKVGIRLHWGTPVDDSYWWEFHRGCARGLTVAQVYARSGLIPL